MNRKAEMPLALYHQIYMILREQLLDGTFAQHEAIPSELALAELYGVSRVTIRATLDKLQSEGLISRERGRGTFPRRPMASRSAPADLRGFMDYLVELGWRTKTKIIEFAYIAPPSDIAEELGLPSDQIVQKAVRLMSDKAGPIAHVTTHLREDIGRSFTRAELQAGPMLPLLERSGIRLSRADQTVTAKLADPKITALLNVPLGSALICMRRTIYDQASRPIEVNQGYYRPDRFEFRICLERPGGMPGVGWSFVDRRLVAERV